MNNRYWKSLVVLTFALVVVSGCGSGGPPLYKAGGTVTYNNKPVENARVTFLYEDGNSSMGMTDAAGKYVLNYLGQAGGAGAGKCKVGVAKEAPGPTVAAAVPKDPRDTMKMMQQVEEERKKREAAGPPKAEIPAKYANPATSGLTFEIKPNNTENDFPIDLKD